jgi:hypothetical protein
MWTAVQRRRLRPRAECEEEGLPESESSGVDTREKLLAEVWE